MAGLLVNPETETAPTEVSPASSDSEEEETVGGHDGIEEASGPSVATIIPEGMSKNQWKKRQKQRLKEQTRKEWRQKQREKDKEKRRKRKLEGLSVPERIKKKHRRSVDEVEASSAIRVAIDLGYEHLMGDKDIKMVVKQCQRCYSVNRRADCPLQFYVTSFGGHCKQRMDSILQGYQNWTVQFRPANYMDEFGKDNVVFLAAESPNILSDLDPGKVYIIGGLVDHNHHKGYCYQMALENGVAHAQLPISEYIKLNCRNVLAINHVFEILLGYVQCKDWEKAFYDVIPQRKLAAAKDDISDAPSTTTSTDASRPCGTDTSGPCDTDTPRPYGTDTSGHCDTDTPRPCGTDTSGPCDATSLCLKPDETREGQFSSSPSGEHVTVAADSSGRLTDPAASGSNLPPGDDASGSPSACKSCDAACDSSTSRQGTEAVVMQYGRDNT